MPALRPLLHTAALALPQLAGAALALVAAMTLPPAAFGSYTLALVFAEAGIALGQTGFCHLVVTRAGPDSARMIATLARVQLALGCLTGMALALLSGPLARVFGAPEMAPLLLVLALFQPLAAQAGWQAARLMRAGRMGAYARAQGGAHLLALILGTGGLLLFASPWALIAARGARAVSGLLLLSRAAGPAPAHPFSPALAREAVGYARGLWGARGLSFAAQYGGDLVLGLGAGPEAAGLYRAAHRLAGAGLDLILAPLRLLALRDLGQAAQKGAALSPRLTTALTAAAALGGGMAGALWMLGPAVVSTLFRPDYAPTAPLVGVLALRALLLFPLDLTEAYAAATRRTSRAMGLQAQAGALAGLACLAAPFGLWPLALAQTGAAALIALRVWVWLDRPALTPVAGAAGLALLYTGALSVPRAETLIPALTAAALLALPALWIAARTGTLRALDLRAPNPSPPHATPPPPLPS